MISRLLSLLAIPALAAALDTSPWQYQAAIELPPGAAGIAALRLTRDIYIRSRPDLADLRVVRAGEEVPYLIEARAGSVENRETEPAVLNKSVVPGRGLQLTLDLGGHFQHSRLRLATAETNFRQKVRIETSNDERSWVIARKDGCIFDFSQGDRHAALVTVDYPTSTMRFVRATIFGWQKTGAVRQVWSGYHKEQPAERDIMDAIVPEVSEDLKTKSTLLSLDLKQPGVPYDHIRLECDAQHFYRAAELETSPDAKTWQFAARGTIYQTADQSSLGLGFVERHDRYLRLRIFNRDDRPMSVRRVVVETTARLVKFAVVHSEGRFLLFTGNPDAKAPSYDFAAVLEREAPQPDVRATLLAPSVNPGYHPLPAPQKPWSERYPQLLYGTLAVAIAVMGYIAIRYLLKIKSASP